ncbi:MAG: adenosylcobinamide-GDP ribazoletransferase [Hyphomicrobiaceae bacterium]
MLRRIREDIVMAFGLLTRVPMPRMSTDANRQPADAFWAMPLTGLVIGGGAGLVLWGCLAIGLGAGLAAIAALATMAILTGGLHDDGLADFWDGIGGGGDRERRLEIMRDSQIGTYGVVALIILYAALVSVLTDHARSSVPPLTTADTGASNVLNLGAIVGLSAMLARSMLFVPLTLLSSVHDNGLAHYFGRPRAGNLALGLVWPIALAAVILQFNAIAPVAGSACGALLVTAIAARYLGGYTGDVLGASIMTSFAGGLIAMGFIAK